MSASASHEIILFAAGESFPGGTLDALSGANHTARTCESIEELSSLAFELPEAFISLTLPPVEDDAIALIKFFIRDEAIRNCPVLAIGEEADGFETVLDKYFAHSVTLNTPCSSQDVLNAIEYLEESVRAKSETSAVSSPPEESSNEATGLLEDDAVTDAVFHGFDQIGGFDKKIGGADFKPSLSFEEVIQLGLLPQDEKLKAGAEEVYNQTTPWVREHLCRTTYVLDRFLEALMLTADEREYARAASLLLPYAFLGHANVILRQNYLSLGSQVKQALASKLKDSALEVSNTFQHPRVGEILSGAAKLIAGEVTIEEGDIPLSASALVAAELFDRISFQSGYWTSRGSHFLLKHAKAGELNSLLHPEVLACLIKFLSEAIASLPKTFLMNKHTRDDPELKQAREDHQNYEPEENEKLVPIDSLQPGMRLSKPVVAYDGREILAGEVLLDEDLIWRLWQLSAVRPMNSPMIVDDED